jgi:hypothetical protein
MKKRSMQKFTVKNMELAKRKYYEELETKLPNEFRGSLKEFNQYNNDDYNFLFNEINFSFPGEYNG